MKDFAALYKCLDETTKTNRKIDCLRNYFASVAAADGAWAVYFLTGRKPKRLVRSADLRAWGAAEANIPEWLFEECHATVGDLAETIALLLDEPERSTDDALHVWVERLLQIAGLDPAAQRVVVADAWRQMNRTERLVWNKLLTGEFRVGVSQTIVVRALAMHASLAPAAVAHRLMGIWEPTETFFRALITQETTDTDVSRPYPFCLAHPLAVPPEELGDVADWQAEWKWDGIRAQLIRREGTISIWTRGEELVTERFPELAPATALLPEGTVLDGEIVGWSQDRVMAFGHLQRRIGRKTLGARILETVPVRFIAFDLLEHDGHDIRNQPLSERRRRLEALVGNDDGAAIMRSPVEVAKSWDELDARRAASRENNVEGLMLKSLASPYAVGRVTGLWWKWKIEPYTVDAVLVYAQLGHGRRAGLYTDYTFAIWNDGELVPFAKAYSGLTDEEIREVDRFVRQNTLERFGPVRRVAPRLVFEIAFESLQLSKRHKSGIAVRFPRIARQRSDKLPQDADSLAHIQELLAASPVNRVAASQGGGDVSH